MVDQFGRILKAKVLQNEPDSNSIEASELSQLFKIMSGKEKLMKRTEFQKFISTLNLLPARKLKSHMNVIEQHAIHLINLKNDLYFLDLISLMRPFLTLTSQNFLSILLQTIDQRILLLHRNLPGLLIVLETLDQLGVTDPLLYRSIEQFVSTQLPNVAFLNNHNNMDLVLSITNLFNKHLLGDISADYKREFANSLSRYLKTPSGGDNQEQEDISFKIIEKIAKMQAKVLKEGD